jgi:hypothetical protein
VAVVVEVLAVEGAESTFFRRSGRSAGMSVAVYLRTRGLSASARSPVPALFYFMSRVERVSDLIYECEWGRFLGNTHPSSRMCA